MRRVKHHSPFMSIPSMFWLFGMLLAIIGTGCWTQSTDVAAAEGHAAAAAAGSTGAGDGPDVMCTPGTIAPCYSGPPETENVGRCHGGTMTCNGYGTGHGPCIGEVTPALETCDTPEDDDCDGMVNEDGSGCAPALAVP